MREKKSYPIHLTNYWSYFEEEVEAQKLTWDSDGFCGTFHVQNLNECPEDAIIRRDLFSAHDFIDVLKFGMALARKGYTDLDVTEKIKVIGDED